VEGEFAQEFIKVAFWKGW